MKNNRIEHIHIRVTKEEREDFEKVARALNLTMSKALRKFMLECIERELFRLKKE